MRIFILKHSSVVETVEDSVSRFDSTFKCLRDEQEVLETFDAALKIDVKGKLLVECSTFRPGIIGRSNKKVIGAGADPIAVTGMLQAFQKTK